MDSTYIIVFKDENDNSNTKNEDNPSSEEPPKRPPGTFSVFD